MKEKKKAVYLSEEIYNKIEQRIHDTEFSSVNDYVTFVLEEILKEDEEEGKTFTEEEEEEVKKRLKALGYLD